MFDPLKSALDEIASKMDAETQPLIAALLSDESVEDAWEAGLKGLLDEA